MVDFYNRDDQTIQVGVFCPFCKLSDIVEVNVIDYDRWVAGELLCQDAFPYLSDDEREQLITGTCADCWNNLFGENIE